MRRIMVATDGSEGANRAVGLAAELARAFGGKLSIVTVSGNLSGEEMRELVRAERNIGDALEALAMQILTSAEKRAQSTGLTDIQLEIGWGDAARSIIEMAARESADAIVLGRRGRGRLAGLILGSVSQKVASLAPCAVVIVP